MDAFFFPWGAEIELKKKKGSLNIVLIAFFNFLFGLWAVGIVIFNSLQRMKI